LLFQRQPSSIEGAESGGFDQEAASYLRGDVLVVEVYDNCTVMYELTASAEPPRQAQAESCLDHLSSFINPGCVPSDCHIPQDRAAPAGS
jgi:hypothetical protein